MVDFAPDRVRVGSGLCASWLAETIYLPNGDAMPDHEWQRMAAALRDVASVSVPHCAGEPLASRGVPIAS
jgi:hypothetical protein